MTTYIIAERSNYEFYHWFYYALSSLYRITDISDTVYFTVPMNGLEFQEASLKYLKHTYVYTPNIIGNACNLEHTHIDDNNCIVEKEIFPFFRRNFYEKNTFPDYKPLSRNIYISRAKSPNYNNRKLLNESSIFPFLTEKNFEIIYLEDYSFDEKVKIFYEARIIVTPVGGAMSLGFFMNEKAKMIEISTPKIRSMDCYEDIYLQIGIPFRKYTNIQGVETSSFPNFNLIDSEDFKNMIEYELSLLY
jgi:hypothetical protein